MLSGTLNKVDEVIAGLREEMTSCLQELVRIPSVTGNEGRAQDFMRRQYDALGLKVHTLTADRAKIDKHPAFSDTGIPFEGRPNIIGICIGNPDKKSILLNGHIDTVSPEPLDQWKHNPFGGEIENNYLFGRGALDMKSGLIANLFALKVLLNAGIDPGGTVMLQSVIEEEDVGGGGTLACLIEGYTADGMIVSEPAPWVTVALAGILRCMIKVRGKSAHPAQSHLGINAISKMIPIYNAIEALDIKRKAEVQFPLFQDFQSGGPACHLIVGTFRAGDYIAMVPGFAEIGCRIGFIPGESPQFIQDLIEATVKQAADKDPWLKENPPTVKWLSYRADPFFQDPDDPFVKTVIASAQFVAGSEMQVKARGGTWSEDTRYASQFGIPALSFGPMGERAHGVDECVDLSFLESTVKALTLAVINWCSQKK